MPLRGIAVTLGGGQGRLRWRLMCRRVNAGVKWFFFSSRRRHTRWTGDWSSDVCSSDLLAQILAIHEGFVQRARAHALHHLGEIVANRLVGEQALIQLALNFLRERGPVAAHHFHADELDDVGILALFQSHIPLARAPRAVPRARQEESQVKFLELERQAALYLPA